MGHLVCTQCLSNSAQILPRGWLDSGSSDPDLPASLPPKWMALRTFPPAQAAYPSFSPILPLPDALMFETEDLVLRKNVKNVVLCLLELGRRAWRFGVAAPTLVQLEEEIEEELRQELALPPPDLPRPLTPTRRPCHFHNLDRMVRGSGHTLKSPPSFAPPSSPPPAPACSLSANPHP